MLQTNGDSSDQSTADIAYLHTDINEDLVGAAGIRHNYNSDLDPEFIHFKAFNLIQGKKMPVHKSTRMVNSIAEGIRLSNEKFYNNDFKGANNIHPAQFFTSDLRGIKRQ